MMFSQLRSKVVRDMCFAIGSPGLLRKNEKFPVLADRVGSRLLELNREWILELDQRPSGLLDFLADPKRNAQRLGLYMAALVEYFIRECHGLKTRRLITNQQVVDRDAVLGSLKYVFSCAPTDLSLRKALALDAINTKPQPGRPGLVHLEVSVKFFVFVASDSSNLHAFVGPFLHETLATRMIRCQRKLELSNEINVRKWATREILEIKEDAIVKSFASFSVLRGYLFYPFHIYYETTQNAANESILSPDHLRGWWTKHSLSSLPNGSSHAIVLSKQHWLSPAVCFRSHEDNNYYLEAAVNISENLITMPQERAVPVTRLDTSVWLQRGSAPVMIATLKIDENNADKLIETSRGFVLPNDWDASHLVEGKPIQKTSKRKVLTAWPKNPHPSMAGPRAPLETSPRQCVVAIDEELLAPVASAHEFLDRLEKCRASVLMERATGILRVSSLDSHFVIEAIKVLGERRMPRMSMVRIGNAILDAADKAELQDDCTSAADNLIRSFMDNQSRLDVHLIVRLADKYGSPNIFSAEVIARHFRRLLGAKQPKALTAAAKMVPARRRSSALTSKIMAQGVVELVRAGAIETAKMLCTAPLADDDADTLYVDSVAAEALVKACRDLGHAKRAQKLENELLDSSKGSSSTSTPSLVLQYLYAHDEEVHSGLRRAQSALTRVQTKDGDMLDIADKSMEIFVDTEDGLLDALAELTLAPVLGLDVEWPPSESEAKASLLQIAAPDKIYLIDLYAVHNFAEASRIRHLLVHSYQPPIFIFGGHGDITKLSSSYPALFRGLEASRFIELQSRRTQGLAAAVHEKLGSHLCKRLQCSDWSIRPLSHEQLRYAALDALVLLALAADTILRNWTCVTKPPSSSFELIPHSKLSPDVCIAKTLALVANGKNNQNHRLLVIVPLNRRLDLSAVAAVCDGTKFRMVHQAHLAPLFGFDKGSIGPLGPGAPVILDNALADQRIACGCGDPAWHIVLRGRTLCELSSEPDDNVPMGLRPPSSVRLASVSTSLYTN